MSLPVFPFRPNWGRALVERLEWLTDITEAKRGQEERIPLRSMPRRAMEYTALLQGGQMQRLDALLWRHQAQQWLLPLWPAVQILPAALEAGAALIPAATAGQEFAPGAYAVLWQDDLRCAAVQIEAVTPAGLELAAPLAQAWPACTRLYPAAVARMPHEVALLRPSAAVAQATLRFELAPVAAPMAESEPAYRGHPVALRRPNWVSPLAQRMQRKLQRLDYETGAIFQDDLSGHPSTVRTHRVLLRDRADIAAWRAWLHARRGRAGAFWQPQWQQDLTPAAPVSAAASTLTVRALGAALYALEEGRRDIALLHRPTGQWRFRRVLGHFGHDDVEVLTLDAPLGINAQPDDLFVTWLCLSRLDADAIEIAWHTAAAAVAVYDIRSVRE